ncbi:MAG TPA: hypothetical protein VGD05_12225 [Pyrinomonadaceae bacterium]|jgi:hypothetical protein
MGQVILEIPQNVNRTFRIESEKRAAEILEQLEDNSEDKIKQATASGAIKLPTRKRTKKISNDVLGIWADREELGNEKESGVVPPRRNNLREDGEKVSGIWSARPESAQEIARQIRERNRKVT